MAGGAFRDEPHDVEADVRVVGVVPGVNNSGCQEASSIHSIGDTSADG